MARRVRSKKASPTCLYWRKASCCVAKDKRAHTCGERTHWRAVRVILEPADNLSRLHARLACLAGVSRWRVSPA
eukprot:3236007-Pleurochrysis_carterae.AAC.2